MSGKKNESPGSVRRGASFGFLIAALIGMGALPALAQVYTEEDKASIVYLLPGGWDMKDNEFWYGETLGSGVLPSGFNINNIVTADVGILSDVDPATGLPYFQTSMYRLNWLSDPSGAFGGQYHFQCSNLPQCAVNMKRGSGALRYFNGYYASSTTPRVYVKMDYLKSGTGTTPTTGTDYYFPIKPWDMRASGPGITNSQVVVLTGLDIRKIASSAATIYSDPVDGSGHIQVVPFERRGYPSTKFNQPYLHRGGQMQVVNYNGTSSSAQLMTLYKQNTSGDNASLYDDGHYVSKAANRGWVKVSYAGTSSGTPQPYAIKTRIMPIGSWPIFIPETDVAPQKTQETSSLSLSAFGISAKRIVHAEVTIHSDVAPGSSSQEHTITNLMRTRYVGESTQNSHDHGLFFIDEAADAVQMLATGINMPNPPVYQSYYAANHSGTGNRGWVLIDYLAAQCADGPGGFTETFIGAFTSDANDCHGSYTPPVGSPTIHVIQTKWPDIWNSADQFYFINKPQNASNFTIQARVDKQDSTNSWARAGVMVRASLSAGSKHVAMVVTPGNGVGFTVRNQDNTPTSETSPNNNKAPYWVKIVKSGNTLTGYMSPSGADNSWAVVGAPATVSFPTNAGTYYAGLCQTAGNNSPSVYNTSVYSNVILSSTYRIMNRNSGKALEVSGSSLANGGNVDQRAYTAGNNQIWYVSDLGNGYWKIINKNSGKALDVNGASTADGANVQQWDYSGGANQLWQLTNLNNGYFKITAKHSGKALDVYGASTADGANVDQWTSNGGNNQQWQLLDP